MVRYLELTDIDNDELTVVDSSSANPGVYSLTFAGATADYAYIGIGGNLSLRLESVNVYATTAVAFDTEIQYYKSGTIGTDAVWIKKAAHDKSLIAADAAMYNNVLSAEEVIDGTPMRIMIDVAGACTVHLKVLKR